VLVDEFVPGGMRDVFTQQGIAFSARHAGDALFGVRELAPALAPGDLPPCRKRRQAAARQISRL
jgi:hypothetical protein